jgi:hypothetical protein
MPWRQPGGRPRVRGDHRELYDDGGKADRQGAEYQGPGAVSGHGSSKKIG